MVMLLVKICYTETVLWICYIIKKITLLGGGGGTQWTLMWHFVKMGPAPIPQIFQFFELLIWRHSCIGIPMRYGKSKVEWIQNIHGNSHTPLENKGGHEFQGGLGNPKGCQISKTPWGFQWQSLFPAREAVSSLKFQYFWLWGDLGGKYVSPKAKISIHNPDLGKHIT